MVRVVAFRDTAILCISLLLPRSSLGFSRNPFLQNIYSCSESATPQLTAVTNDDDTRVDEEGKTAAVSNAPILNGKRVLPLKVLTGGLKGHRVAAVYAVLNNNYKRG